MVARLSGGLGAGGAARAAARGWGGERRDELFVEGEDGFIDASFMGVDGPFEWAALTDRKLSVGEFDDGVHDLPNRLHDSIR